MQWQSSTSKRKRVVRRLDTCMTGNATTGLPLFQVTRVVKHCIMPKRRDCSSQPAIARVRQRFYDERSCMVYYGLCFCRRSTFLQGGRTVAYPTMGRFSLSVVLQHYIAHFQLPPSNRLAMAALRLGRLQSRRFRLQDP